jgi:hypothetical protein
MKAGQQAATLWTSGQKAWTSARSWIKGWTGEAPAAGPSSVEIEHEVKAREPVDAPPVPEGERTDEKEHITQEEAGSEAGDGPRKPLWGPCECCISCVSHLRLQLRPKLIVSWSQSTFTQRTSKVSVKVCIMAAVRTTLKS